MISDVSFSDPDHEEAEHTFSFTYDRLGRMLTLDDAGRLLGLAYAHDSTSIVTHSWAFDAAGRITQYGNSIDGTVDYSNDYTGQLTAAPSLARRRIAFASPHCLVDFTSRRGRELGVCMTAQRVGQFPSLSAATML